MVPGILLVVVVGGALLLLFWNFSGRITELERVVKRNADDMETNADEIERLERDLDTLRGTTEETTTRRTGPAR